jgi:hypothetical protein
MLSLLGLTNAASLISASVAPRVSSSWCNEAGREGAFSCEVGGGGSGDALASPMRRSVTASWAFVGMPLSRELGLDCQ